MRISVLLAKGTLISYAELFVLSKMLPQVDFYGPLSEIESGCSKTCEIISL